MQVLTNWSELTCRERFSMISLRTGAGGDVIDNFALSIDSTQSWARVNAVKVATCSGCRAVIIDETFRLACLVRISKVIF